MKISHFRLRFPVIENFDPAMKVIYHIFFEEIVEKSDNVFPGTCDAVIHGGVVLANILLLHQSSKTFNDYYINTFHPDMCNDIESFSCRRIDLIWDRYITPSIKGETRQKRGEGTRT
ncbi:hypothetical protein JTB14_023656 [Gonioctena quinquepunctata]|nr:hypothetical protein JTB14_023656 [Gonioctena quinquepunctata]